MLILGVRAYQISLGPLLRILNGGRGLCRHQPTCSEYAIEALRTHGAWRGIWLTVRRLLRCQPWGTYGFDPVPPRVNRSGRAGQKETSNVESNEIKE
ncbi:MAG TPA: membrane protein insertion efficiency factor YidD [Pirellulaceae bacterium]|nr:membrane protein insertion efficiency factor YidD [Pirellulaceae bacterium]